MFDAGKLEFYSLQNIAAAGLMPTEALVKLGEAFYYERTIGINRAYSAMSANQRIDKLVRCYHQTIPTNAEYVILEDGLQYRITLKQVLGDDVDLTLERLEAMLDVSTADTSEDTDGTDGDNEP